MPRHVLKCCQFSFSLIRAHAQVSLVLSRVGKFEGVRAPLALPSCLQQIPLRSRVGNEDAVPRTLPDRTRRGALWARTGGRPVGGIRIRCAKRLVVNLQAQASLRWSSRPG